MIDRLLCLLGFHAWGPLNWDRSAWRIFTRCRRRGCNARRYK